MQEHQMESLLNDPGSSSEEFEEKIRGLSWTELDTLSKIAFARESVPRFVGLVLFRMARAETLAASESVELEALRSRLPFCDDKTDSDANVNPLHDPRSRHETTINFDAVQNIPDSVWQGIVHIGSDKETIPVQSENSVVFYLSNLYRGIIKALGINNKLQVIVTRMIAGNECDIVLAAKETYQPLSVTEVKKPHSRANDQSIFLLPTNNERRSSRLGEKAKSRTVGQHFDQLHNVKWMLGSNSVYGMISTGNSFMLTCTEPFPVNGEFDLPSELFITEQDNGNGEDRVSPIKPIIFDNGPAYCQPDEEAELHTSQVIEIKEAENRAESSQRILNMLILQVAMAVDTLEKMSTSETKLPESGKVFSRQINLERDIARTGNKQCFTQVYLKTDWQKCRLQYINDDVKVVSLVRSVGSGASGDCCFAVSENQNMSCVVKFFQASQDNTTLAQAKSEKKNWDRAYGTGDFETRVVDLGVDRGCLIMPYVDVAGISREKCLQDEAASLKACLRRFSFKDGGRRFLLHRDVKWRHLGLLKGELTLIDLGHVEETQDVEQREDWIKSCVKELAQSNCFGRQKRRRVVGR